MKNATNLLTRIALSLGRLRSAGAYATALPALPAIHRRAPFDRMLVAQALIEGVTLVTSDEIVARYPGPIRHV